MPKPHHENRHKREHSGITLSDIVRGLQHCVNSSQDIVEQHHIKTLDRFLTADGLPIVKTIKMGDNAAIDIPLLCLNGHTALVLDELDVKIELMIKTMMLKTGDEDTPVGPYSPNPPAASDASNHKSDNSDKEKGGRGRSRKRQMSSDANLTRSSFGVELANITGPDRRHAHLGISMKFKSAEPPELLSRIIDKINNAVDVYPISED